MSTSTVVIIADSPRYHAHCDKIKATLDKFGLSSELRIASAYRTPARLLAILEEYQSDITPHVYITVSCYGDAVAGLADAHVHVPVINCPPLETTAGQPNTFPAIMMPPGVGPMLVLGPENAALAAAKILGFVEPELRKKIDRYRQANAYRLVSADVKKE